MPCLLSRVIGPPFLSSLLPPKFSFATPPKEHLLFLIWQAWSLSFSLWEEICNSSSWVWKGREKSPFLFSSNLNWDFQARSLEWMVEANHKKGTSFRSEGPLASVFQKGPLYLFYVKYVQNQNVLQEGKFRTGKIGRIVWIMPPSPCNGNIMAITIIENQLESCPMLCSSVQCLVQSSK